MGVGGHRPAPALAGAVERQDRAFQPGAALGPAGRGALRIGVDQDGVLSRKRRLRGEMGCDRGLADTTLGTGHQHCLHALPPHRQNDQRGYTGPGTAATAQPRRLYAAVVYPLQGNRSEEHTSELQSLMRTSYAVFSLKKNKNN